MILAILLLIGLLWSWKAAAIWACVFVIIQGLAVRANMTQTKGEVMARQYR
jgi:hypothetical protein